MNLKYSSEKKESFAICYIMFFEYINYLAHSILKLLGIQIYHVTIALTVVGMFLLLYLILKKQAIVLPVLALPLIVAGLYFLSLELNVDGADIIREAVFEKLFLYCIPTYIAVRLIGNYEDFYDMLGKFSVVILITQTLAIFCTTYLPDRSVYINYQGISYGLLIPFIYFVCKEKYNGKIIATIVFITFLMVFFGGRGPILCAFLCFLYKLLLNIKKNKIWIFVLFFGGIMFLLLYDDILDIIVSIAKENGFTGSLVFYSNRGDVFSDSGRNEILEVAKEVIKEKPWGSGLGSTRYLLGVYGYKYGNYPHNIFYEFWCDYGILIGTILIIVLIVSIIKTFMVRTANPNATILFEICFFSTGFLILTFSTSYSFCPLFFAMIAIMQNIHKELKNNNETFRMVKDA